MRATKQDRRMFNRFIKQIIFGAIIIIGVYLIFILALAADVALDNYRFVDEVVQRVALPGTELDIVVVSTSLSNRTAEKYTMFLTARDAKPENDQEILVATRYEALRVCHRDNKIIIKYVSSDFTKFHTFANHPQKVNYRFQLALVKVKNYLEKQGCVEIN